jgi:hypothetical protein
VSLHHAATGLHLIEPEARNLAPDDILIATDQWATVTSIRVNHYDDGDTASITISPLTDPDDFRILTIEDADAVIPALRDEFRNALAAIVDAAGDADDDEHAPDALRHIDRIAKAALRGDGRDDGCTEGRAR